MSWRMPGIDRSNIDPDAGGRAGAAAAARSRCLGGARCARGSPRISPRALGVIVNDSFGRAWRRGTVGIALGRRGAAVAASICAAVPDLYGRALRVSETGFADEIAAAASLLMGQADEGVPAVLVRGLAWSAPAAPAASSDPRRPMRICSADGRGARDRVVALSGGVGGAKLALGLARVLAPGTLTVVANTGDDFEHLGLAISPDLDTLLYTLAGLDNPATGLGPARRDLDLHGGAGRARRRDLVPARRRRSRHPCRAHAPAAHGRDACRRSPPISAAASASPRAIVPMSDDPVRTRVRTAEGWLDFQDYFVRRDCAPRGRRNSPSPARRRRGRVPDFLAALAAPELRAVVICPSNPFISIEPILAVPGVREALAAWPAPVVAVAPLIGGRAVKGPTAKIMAELGLEAERRRGRASLRRPARRLCRRCRRCGRAAAALAVAVVPARALMATLADREALARGVLAAADAVAARR